MKKLINGADKVVAEMVAGLTLTYGGLQRLTEENVILRFDSDVARPRPLQLSVVVGVGTSQHMPGT